MVSDAMTDDEEPPDNVVPLNPDRDRPPLDVRNPAGGRPCRHSRVYVDEHRRAVECQDCEAPLDPLWVLTQYAYRERRFHFALQTLRQKKRELQKEIEELKREERNAKQRLRRARK
jgi:hypothetical protein